MKFKEHASTLIKPSTMDDCYSLIRETTLMEYQYTVQMALNTGTFAVIIMGDCENQREFHQSAY